MLMGCLPFLWLLFLPQVLIYLSTALIITEFELLEHFCMDDTGNYTNNSVYRSNLDAALSSITSNINATIYGFSNTSFGQNSDTVNALALCRGDIDQITCGECVYNSTVKLRELCPNQKQAIIWYDYCMLRYYNPPIVPDREDKLVFFGWNPDNVSNVDVAQFNDAVGTLFDKIKPLASGGGPLRKFATENVRTVNLGTIYGLVQCTPNLTEHDCNNCLSKAVSDLPKCCVGRIGGKVVRASCNIRYEMNHFFMDTPTDATAPAPSPGKDDNTTRTVIIIVVPIVAFVVIIVVGVFIFVCKRKNRRQKDAFENEDDITTAQYLQYNFWTIRTATDNFSESNKLGQGGFGAVYKGKLENGSEIAVKRLSVNSGQGDLEFKNEVVLVAKLQHRNLVRLLGFCLEGIERLLIYEFMPNASLDHFIFDPVNRAVLDCERRLKIIQDIARGLLYLHEDSRLRIIHRDLKASNILLDSEMNAKIADFGMARLFEIDETQGNTSRIVGTYGYMAPEYAMHGQFSVKSDVFSFGVMVLEIVSGQRNNCFRDGENVVGLLSYAWKNWKERRGMNLIDPILRSNARPIRDIMRCIHIGLLCVQENPSDRPTMASIVLMLNSFSITLPVPSEPAFFIHSSVVNREKPLIGGYDSERSKSSEWKNVSAEVSNKDTSITEVYPR